MTYVYQGAERVRGRTRKGPNRKGAETTGILFIISSDFDLEQHFSCSMKTVECGQIFILACQQLRKKAQHNFIGQFQNLLNLPRPGPS